MFLKFGKRHIAGIAILVLLASAGCPSAKYTLTVAVTGEGSVTLTPSGGSYEAGTKVALVPAPAANWRFDHWEGALTGNENPGHITINEAKAVTAVFVQDRYYLNVSTTGSGSVFQDPMEATYAAGAVVTLTAVNPAEWHFDHWEGDLTGTANPAQVSMTGHKDITAVFVKNEYTLSVSVTGTGTVALEPPGGVYPAGTVVTLTTSPGLSWDFDHWEGALTGNAMQAQVTMDGNRAVTAVFALERYPLSLGVSGSGGITQDPFALSYEAGSVVTLTAEEYTHWHFDHWEGDVTGTANPVQVVMNGLREATAFFVRNEYALNVNVAGSGSVTLDPPGGLYPSESSVTLTPEPADGWRFDHWTGMLVGDDNPAEVEMNAAKNITAVFVEEQEYTLTVNLTGNGTVTLEPPGGSYPAGTVVTITPHPDAEHRFEIWGGQLEGIKQPATITMDEDKYVVAYFMPQTYSIFSPGFLCTVGPTVYFLATGMYSGQELWKSDGTFEGTSLVRDISPGNSSAGIQFLMNFKDTLYFFAPWQGYYWLWTSDGTEEGTVPVANLGSSWPALRPVQVGDFLYFSAAGMVNGELWVTDGTADGTRIVKSFGPDTGMLYSNPGNLTNVDGVLYFNNQPQDELMTMWKSDGTEAGTVPVFSARYLVEIAGINGKVVFYAGKATWEVNNDALYVLDDTPNGGHLLHEYSFGPGELTLCGNVLYFAAEYDWYNTQIWATDGANVYKVSNFSYRPWDLTNLNGALLYVALYEVDSQAHCGLFSGGTLLKEINWNLFYGYSNYRAIVDGILFFTAENSTGGVGLWKSDGTSAGTVMVSDITAVPVGVAPSELTAGEHVLYFSAGDEAHGHQLWKSDGTLEGTLPVSCPMP